MKLLERSRMLNWTIFALKGNNARLSKVTNVLSKEMDRATMDDINKLVELIETKTNMLVRKIKEERKWLMMRRKSWKGSVNTMKATHYKSGSVLL